MDELRQRFVKNFLAEEDSGSAANYYRQKPMRVEMAGCLQMAAFKMLKKKEGTYWYKPTAALMLYDDIRDETFVIGRGLSIHWRELARFCDNVAAELEEDK